MQLQMSREIIYTTYLSEHKGQCDTAMVVSRLKQHFTLIKEEHCIVYLSLTE